MATRTATKKKPEKTLRDLFVEELADMYDSENRIAKALPKLAKAAADEELKEALESHLEETRGQIETLESVFELFDAKPRGKKCEAMVGILKEGDEVAREFKGSRAADAALISACQKVEHYEIAAYGALCEWATVLGYSEAADMLAGILDEEKATDEILTDLARASSNPEAASGEVEAEEDEEEI